MKITIVGLAYVGLSNAVLLAQHNKVFALDFDHCKVAFHFKIARLDELCAVVADSAA